MLRKALRGIRDAADLAGFESCLSTLRPADLSENDLDVVVESVVSHPLFCEAWEKSESKDQVVALLSPPHHASSVILGVSASLESLSANVRK